MITLPSARSSTQNGFSYLEIIIASGILLIIAHAFFTLITAAYQLIGLSRINASGRALANQQIELIRNLPYNSVGTVGGIPSGLIPQTQTKILNGQTFTIKTSILYVDDPFDNLAPADLLPVDYKRVRVSITWTSVFPTEDIIQVFTDISPKGIESIANGGTLYIQVFDTLGNPVQQADVSISAPLANPPINLDLFTDNNGNLVIPGAPICTSCYNLTVTKNGYSTDQTHTAIEVTNPIKPPATVLNNQITQISFSIDHLASVTLQSLNSAQIPRSNTTFHLQSADTIGTTDTGSAVYQIDNTYTTDSNGTLTLNLKSDTYTISLDPNNYDFAGSNPKNPLIITAGQTITISFIAASHSGNSLLTLVQDPAGTPISTASAHLVNSNTTYDATVSAGINSAPDYGYIYFNSIPSGNYILEITHPDYITNNQNLTINNSSNQTIILNPH